LERILKIPFSIGVGGRYWGYDRIAESYCEALDAVQAREVAKEPGVFMSGDIEQLQSSHRILLSKAKAYIDRFYGDEELNLIAIAREVHTSPSYVSTLFKKYYHVNLGDYIMGVRMEKAAELLAKTDYKAYEISERVGYGNPQYFSVLFKRYSGLSPTEYRKQFQESSCR